MTKYIIGPYDRSWLESLYYDITSGVTIGLILIPQGLAYSKLAGLPAINGLYAAIVPSFTYTVLGSSMQLAVGPVAVVSLLTSQIVTKYCAIEGTDLTTAQKSDPGLLLDITAQCCICVGIILTAMGVLNLGRLIHFVSHPVMSAFTSAAAWTIGLSQLPDAVGFQVNKNLFREVPKLGQPGYHYNYEVMAWYTKYWYENVSEADLLSGYDSTKRTEEEQVYRYSYALGWKRYNPWAQKIFAGVYIPLMLILLFKERLKETPERKKTVWFNLLKLANPVLAFVAIIIAGAAVRNLMQDPSLYTGDYPESRLTDAPPIYKWSSTSNSLGGTEDAKSYEFGYSTSWETYMQGNINIVGSVSQDGLNFGRIPTMRFPFGQFFIDVLPLTFVLFMESFSVARRLAAQRNQLHFLDASQEMFANGVANLLGAVASAYPVAGSFSRSSLLGSLGGKTPLAKLFCMFVILIAVGTLQFSFYYIPKAALSAVIFVAIYGLISATDFWEAWKHSKRDFAVMLITFIFVFVFDTGIGLAIGMGASAVNYLFDLAFSPSRAPRIITLQKGNDGIDVVRVDSELTFFTISRLTEFVSEITRQEIQAPVDEAGFQDKLFYRITSTLDKNWTLGYKAGVSVLPKAVVLDLTSCTFIDLTAIQGILEITSELKGKNVLFVYFNASVEVDTKLRKFGVINSQSTADCNLDQYLQCSTSLEEINPHLLLKGTSVNMEPVIIATASFDREDIVRTTSFDPEQEGMRKRTV